MSVDSIFQSLWFLSSGFPWWRVAAIKEATEPGVPFSKVEVITSKILRSTPWRGWPLWNICVTNDHGYVSLVNTSRSFPHSWLITRLVTRLTRRVPLVKQELLTLPEHMSASPVLSGVCVAWSLVFSMMFSRSLFVLLYFFFWPLCCLFFDIYGLWLPLWYLQALLPSVAYEFMPEF